MASGVIGDRSEGKPNSSDNTTTVCGYKDVNEFSQVADSYLQFIATHVLK